jgi:hypothetical protein
MIKRSMGISAGIVVGVLQLFFTAHAFGQASRTWVSGVGDDANPCSRTAPCKTFAGAISKTAAGGEINALDPAGYGSVTITKSITINGAGTMASVLVAGTNGIVVAAGPSDVVILRNISINGIGSSGNGGLNGIRFLSGAAMHVEHCEIRSFTQQGIDVAPSASGNVFVSNTELRDNDGGGIYVHPGAAATVYAVIDHVSMHDGGRGLRAEDGSVVTVSNSIATGNAGNGFVALAASRPVDLTIKDSVSSLNGQAGVYSGALARVRISDMTVNGNNVGLQAAGGVLISFGTNAVNGNGTNGAPTQSVGRI